jgi:hypothetical protein
MDESRKFESQMISFLAMLDNKINKKNKKNSKSNTGFKVFMRSRNAASKLARQRHTGGNTPIGKP